MNLSGKYHHYLSNSTTVSTLSSKLILLMNPRTVEKKVYQIFEWAGGVTGDADLLINLLSNLTNRPR